MTFWTYMIQCGDRHLYVGHTNDLEKRMGEHQAGVFAGYTSTRHPLHLVWSQEFPSRYEAVEAERRLKGWSKAKKLALIRGDWALISALAKNKREGRASTSSAQTEKVVRMSHFLHPHPVQIPSEPFSLEATARFSADRIRARFRLTGPVKLLQLPPRAEPTRRDNLWQHTCFEAFLAIEGGYLEFNLSPSTEWAAYRFSGYREGMAPLDVEPPGISVSRTDHTLELTADIALPPGLSPTRLGLSAVIEEVSGRKSYWALNHPPGDKPDFHHADCFAIELPAPSGS
ncbi:GIY-YIG nuclease family protein [Sphingomonas tabacisoli]|uniref:GIY-YIG nuclease family protein n=1 Tax=Sphingomonas tabacisoli TaxID=2249466 RepID=A0ABW4I2H0_9SPHN